MTHFFAFADNGPHYHNTAVLCYLSEVNSAFDVTLVQYNNFEAGEGKSVLDTHFAHISHKIVRWVRLGHNIESGQQLGDLVQVSSDSLTFRDRLFSSKTLDFFMCLKS